MCRASFSTAARKPILCGKNFKTPRTGAVNSTTLKLNCWIMLTLTLAECCKLPALCQCRCRHNPVVQNWGRWVDCTSHRVPPEGLWLNRDTNTVLMKGIAVGMIAQIKICEEFGWLCPFGHCSELMSCKLWRSAIGTLNGDQLSGSEPYNTVSKDKKSLHKYCFCLPRWCLGPVWEMQQMKSSLTWSCQLEVVGSCTTLLKHDVINVNESIA